MYWENLVVINSAEHEAHEGEVVEGGEGLREAFVNPPTIIDQVKSHMIKRIRIQPTPIFDLQVETQTVLECYKLSANAS
jgi:hypothetical protein